MTHGFRSDGSGESVFLPENLISPYPRLHRGTVGMSDPTLGDLKSRLEPILSASSSGSSVVVASQCLVDFHLLIHIFSLGLISQTDGMLLCQAVRKGKEDPSLWSKFLSSKSMESLRNHIIVNAAASASNKAGAVKPWNCPHCTFCNESDPVNCEMCGLPKQ